MKRLVFTLLLVAGGLWTAPAQAGDGYPDKFIKRVRVGKHRPSQGTIKPGSVVWDSDFCTLVLKLGGEMPDADYQYFLDVHKSGSMPTKVQIPEGTEVTNLYVVYRGGDFAEIWQAVNNPRGTFTITARLPRWVCLYGTTWMSPGTCWNKFVWQPPEKPPVVIREKPVETIFVEKRVEVPVKEIVTVTETVIVEERVEVPVYIDRPVEVEVLREVPAPVPVQEKSGYFPGLPGRSIRSEHVASVFAYQRGQVTNVNRRVIIRRERPPFKPPEQPPRGITHGNKGPRQPTLPTWDVRP